MDRRWYALWGACREISPLLTTVDVEIGCWKITFREKIQIVGHYHKTMTVVSLLVFRTARHNWIPQGPEDTVQRYPGWTWMVANWVKEFCVQMIPRCESAGYRCCGTLFGRSGEAWESVELVWVQNFQVEVGENRLTRTESLGRRALVVPEPGNVYKQSPKLLGSVLQSFTLLWYCATLQVAKILRYFLPKNCSMARTGHWLPDWLGELLRTRLVMLKTWRLCRTIGPLTLHSQQIW